MRSSTGFIIHDALGVSNPCTRSCIHRPGHTYTLVEPRGNKREREKCLREKHRIGGNHTAYMGIEIAPPESSVPGLARAPYISEGWLITMTVLRGTIVTTIRTMHGKTVNMPRYKHMPRAPGEARADEARHRWPQPYHAIVLCTCIYDARISRYPRIRFTTLIRSISMNFNACLYLSLP